MASSAGTRRASDAERFRLSTEQIRKLGDKAAEAKMLAYCPYSKFRVGAALLTSAGSIVTGVNVENASYPVGTCAERCAIGKAVSEGHNEFTALAVSTDIFPPASPCGMCRQFIREFCSLETPIFMYGGQDGDTARQTYTVMTLKEAVLLWFELSRIFFPSPTSQKSPDKGTSLDTYSDPAITAFVASLDRGLPPSGRPGAAQLTLVFVISEFIWLVVDILLEHF